MDTCHRWSGEAAAAKTPAGSAGPKPAGGREEGLAAHPGVGHMENGQHSGGNGVAEAGWIADDGAGEERGICLRFKGCVCTRPLPGLRTPAGSAPCRLPAASPSIRRSPACGLPRSAAGPSPPAAAAQRRLARAAGAGQVQPVAAKGGFAVPLATHAGGRRGRSRLCLVGLCLPAAAVPGAARFAAGRGGCGGAGRA